MPILSRASAVCPATVGAGPPVHSVLALALLWWAATRFGWVDVLFLPAPEQLFEALQRLWQEGYLDASLLQHVGTSLLRVLLALGAAVLTAIPLGVLMGLNPLAGAALDPLVEFYRPIPPGLPAVDRHLVRHRRAEQGAADLPGAVRAAADRYRRRRASRRPIAGAGGALPGGQPLAGWCAT